MHWLFLALTIVGGVFGSSMLKISSGFVRAFYFLSIALR
ncbi:Uncharacterised protein [Aggregatibacter actinomycetemcomitans]|nr:Uncharacterised protein [Aggregatibacter actinomycetemcomitans]